MKSIFAYFAHAVVDINDCLVVLRVIQAGLNQCGDKPLLLRHLAHTGKDGVPAKRPLGLLSCFSVAMGPI